MLMLMLMLMKMKILIWMLMLMLMRFAPRFRPSHSCACAPEQEKQQKKRLAKKILKFLKNIVSGDSLFSLLYAIIDVKRKLQKDHGCYEKEFI